ncbi:alpha/beta hydrolase [Posidoniimonas polymericola]|nr:alpha/beta hydrolase [Posidoniimonas polymericola]
MTYLVAGYRTVGLPAEVLHSSDAVELQDGRESLSMMPSEYDAGLLFFCGSGVAAPAYAPLLRPIAEQGHAVFIIKLPYRFAPFESHRNESVDRARRIIAEHPEVVHWTAAGHSLGGALACLLARDNTELLSGLVLIGTTHPKQDDLSSLTMPVAKVYATNDGVAPAERVASNRGLLPPGARFVEIEGGNHCQFGNYAWQFLDGSATISRAEQQDATRSVLLDTIEASLDE